MRMMTCLVAGTLAAAARAAGAQSLPQSHEQHQAAGQHQSSAQHQVAGTGEKCCCEEMMRKMMTEMMQKHQGKGIGMEMPKDAPPADKDPAH